MWWGRQAGTNSAHSAGQVPYKPTWRVEAMDKGRRSCEDNHYTNGLKIQGSQVCRGKVQSKVRKEYVQSHGREKKLLCPRR